MQYEVDDDGDVVVRISKALIAELAPFGGTWLCADQWVLLGSPSGQADRRLLGTTIPAKQAKAALRLAERARNERTRTRTRYPRISAAEAPASSAEEPDLLTSQPEGRSVEVVPACPPYPEDQGTPAVKLLDEAYYIRGTSEKTGKPLTPVPFRYHRCERCGERQLVRHGARSGKPVEKRCVFCGQSRFEKVSSDETPASLP